MSAPEVPAVMPIPDLDGVSVLNDSCRVYIVHGRDRIDLVDFGSGAVTKHLPDSVHSIVLTHHHRDQALGLMTTAPSKADVFVPETELHLVGATINDHLRYREVFNNYNTRDDRFSVLEPVGNARALADHSTIQLGDADFMVRPAPGHTTGGICLTGNVGSKRIAFVGDLMAGPGQLHSLAAMEWSYGGGEGLLATLATLSSLLNDAIDVLLPSHGDPIWNPAEAIELLSFRLKKLVRLRDDPPALWTQRPSVNPTLKHGRVFDLAWMKRPDVPDAVQLLEDFIADPYERISEHLLINKTASGNTHVLLSDAGEALFFDYGYDMFVWPDPAGFDRAKVRTWIYTIGMLKQQFGVTKVSAAIPTHYHDDHMASMNALRRAEGTEVWAPELMVPVLQKPGNYDLPCLWFDPMPIDKLLPDRGSFQWNEYEISVFPLPGHTIFAAAYGFNVDGQRVLNVGDQYRADSSGDLLSCAYVYKNGFRRHDYRDTATEIAVFAPDLILSGHWAPLYPSTSYFTELTRRGEHLLELHDELLPHPYEAGPHASVARIEPFLSELDADDRTVVRVLVANPHEKPCTATIQMVLPRGWRAAPANAELILGPHRSGSAQFELQSPHPAPDSASRIAATITFGGDLLSPAVDGIVNPRGG